MTKKTSTRKTIIKTLLACLAAALLPVSALAADGDWEIRLKASTPQKARNNIFLGQKADATDWYDAKYDGVAMLDGVIKAYFPHSDWGRTTTSYWRDIMGPGEKKKWTVKVECDTAGETITMSWDSTKLPAGYSATLTDSATNTATNMTAAGSYAYTNTGPREFTVETTAPDRTTAPVTPLETTTPVATTTPVETMTAIVTTVETTAPASTTSSSETTTSTTASADLDNTAPTGTISINTSAAYTASSSVTLTLSCTDASGCSQMQFSNDNTTWSTAEAYTTSKAWTLASGDGTKTVYVKFKDTAGNWSSAVSDTIALMALSGNIDSASYSANRVDGYDLIVLSLAFGSTPASPNWNPVCDLDESNAIDGSDLIVVGSHFGESQ